MGAIRVKNATPNHGMTSTSGKLFSSVADKGVNTTPPKDNPVDAIDKATERLGPGNQRVTNVVDTMIETPLLPIPKITNNTYSSASSVACPTKPSAMPLSAAPLIMMSLTS